GVQNRLHRIRRGADHAQDLSSRRLLLKTFAQLSRSIPQLGQQPRVLDRDNRLAREVRNERDLLVGEWAGVMAMYGDDADELVLLEHRTSYYGANTGELNRRNPEWVAIEVALIQTQIRNVNLAACW